MRNIWKIHLRGKILSQNLGTQFRICPPRSMVHQVKQEKEMIGHISFDDIDPSLFLNFSNNGGARIFQTIQVHIVNFDSFFGNFSLNPEMSNFNVLCPCHGFD